MCSIAGEINFKKINDNTYDIYHTYVNENYRGKGIASSLVKEVVKYIKEKNCNVVASCSYAKTWLEKNK